MCSLAVEVLHCTPNEAALRFQTSAEIEEVMAYYRVKEQDRAREDKRAARRAKQEQIKDSARRLARKHSRRREE